MSFRFKLATVLRLREIAEEREERLLGRIVSNIAQTQQALDDLKRQHAALCARRERQLLDRMSAAELHNSYAEMRALEDMQKDTARHLAELEKLRIQQMMAYEAAHCDHEVLSGLRAKELEKVRAKEIQMEQSTMDDNFMSRRSIK